SRPVKNTVGVSTSLLARLGEAVRGVLAVPPVAVLSPATGVSSSGEKSASTSRVITKTAARPLPVSSAWRLRSEAGIFQAVGMVAIDHHRIGFEDAGQADYLVHFVQVVHAVVVTNDLAEVAAAATDQAVVLAVGLADKGGADSQQRQVNRVQHVGQLGGAAPGVVTHVVDDMRAFAARGGWHRGREACIEIR